MTDSIELHGQRFICGDCIPVMDALPSASVDLVITSPPYNIGVPYNLYKDDRDDYFDWTERWCVSLKRLLHDQSSLFLNVGGSLRKPLMPHEVLRVMSKHFCLQNEIIWVKSVYIPEAVHRDTPAHSAGHSFGHFKPVPGQRFLNNTHEFIFHLTLHGDVKLHREEVGAPYVDASNLTRWKTKRTKRCAGNVWYIPYDTRSKKARHPALFPVALPERCIRLHCGKDDGLVLDPFAGIGNVAVAALRQHKRSISIEMDSTYVAEACRAVQVEKQRSTQTIKERQIYG